MADRNRRAVRSPARQRVRSTETVSTSTRSGAHHCKAAAIRVRAARPAEPSSPTTLASTDASITINARGVPRRDRRRHGPGLPAHRADERYVRARHPWWASTLTVSVRWPDTAEVTALLPRRDAADSRALRRADRVPAHSACLHSAIRMTTEQPATPAADQGIADWGRGSPAVSTARAGRDTRMRMSRCDPQWCRSRRSGRRDGRRRT